MILRNAAMQLENPSPLHGAGHLSQTNIPQSYRYGTITAFEMSPSKNGRFLNDNSMIQPGERDARTFIKPIAGPINILKAQAANNQEKAAKDPLSDPEEDGVSSYRPEYE